MKRKSKGKQRLPVAENLIYSNLIYQVASGNNYAQKIYEAYGKKKSASVISRQLDYLNKGHFLTSELKEDKNVFPMQKLRIYSVNWEKLIEEFIIEVKQQREHILEQKEFLKVNMEEVFGSRMNLLNYLDNKEFIEKIKKNSYLQNYLKIYFQKISKISRGYTISSALGYLLLFGDFDFLSSVSINISRIVSFLEKQKKGDLPSDIVGIPESEWKKAVNKAEEKEHREQMKKFMEKEFKEIKTIWDEVERRRKEIEDKDIGLKELLILNAIFSVLKFELTLQTSLNETTIAVGNIILKKHFTEEEIKKAEQFDFGRMRPKTKKEYEDSLQVEETISFYDTKPEGTAEETLSIYEKDNADKQEKELEEDLYHSNTKKPQGEEKK